MTPMPLTPLQPLMPLVRPLDICGSFGLLFGLLILTALQLLRIARTFASVLQLFCPAALLPGLLRCLCRLLLPFCACTAFVICCLACSAAFVYLYCLSGHGRLCLLRCLCRLLLPFSAFTAFVDLLPGLLRCLCQLLQPLSTLLPLSACTAFV